MPNADLDLITTAQHFLSQLKSGPLAIAVSGGADSLAVLKLLIDANGEKRQLYCFTVDHGLRPEAAEEAEFVADICRQHGVVHKTLVWTDVKPKAGLQNAARQARYRLLGRACREIQAVGLVTGHTLDDQIETVTMRMARDLAGNGRGLSGMASSTLFGNELWVLRPFLSVSKTDLQAYLTINGQNWIEDPSNQDEKYERVRIRNNNLYQTDIGQIKKNGLKRTEISELAATYLKDHCIVRDQLVAEVSIQCDKVSVLKRALEVLVDTMGGRERSLSRLDVDALFELATNLQSNNMTLGRTLIKKVGNGLTIERENRGFSECTISPKSNLLWDGRFTIHNMDDSRTLIVAHDPNIRGCPPKFMWQVPNAQDLNWFCSNDSQYVQIQPLLNRFDGVLPSFDLVLANIMVKLMGRCAYLEVPFLSDKAIEL